MNCSLTNRSLCSRPVSATRRLWLYAGTLTLGLLAVCTAWGLATIGFKTAAALAITAAAGCFAAAFSFTDVGAVEQSWITMAGLAIGIYDIALGIASNMELSTRVGGAHAAVAVWATSLYATALLGALLACYEDTYKP